MKHRLAVVFMAIAILSCSSTAVMAESLDDVMNSNKTVITEETNTDTAETTNGITSGETSDETKKNNSNFLNGLAEASDLSANVEGASTVTAGAKKGVGFIVQIISYLITVLLALRVALDLAFIGLPFCRQSLGNGYMGNAQAGGAGQQGGMGMGGMGGGMGMGGMGGMGGRMGGMGMGGMGMGGMGGMGGGMGGPQQSGQQQAMGKIQWVSNAALNAVAGETTVGPDGTAISPFRAYVKDMIMVLVATPVLLTLAVTGVLTTLGLEIGSLLVDAIRNLRGMM